MLWCLADAAFHPLLNRNTTEPEIQCDTVSRWNVFTKALIQVESRGDSLAAGPTEDLGILQITPIYVKEANRIVNEERFTLDDRLSPEKSLEMFSIVQNHYNPDKDIDRAIRLHNPGAGKWYSDRIMEHMDTIILRYAISYPDSFVDRNGNIIIFK